MKDSDSEQETDDVEKLYDLQHYDSEDDQDESLGIILEFYCHKRITL